MEEDSTATSELAVAYATAFGHDRDRTDLRLVQVILEKKMSVDPFPLYVVRSDRTLGAACRMRAHNGVASPCTREFLPRDAAILADDRCGRFRHCDGAGKNFRKRRGRVEDPCLSHRAASRVLIGSDPVLSGMFYLR